MDVDVVGRAYVDWGCGVNVCVYTGVYEDVDVDVYMYVYVDEYEVVRWCGCGCGC